MGGLRGTEDMGWLKTEGGGSKGDPCVRTTLTGGVMPRPSGEPPTVGPPTEAVAKRC